MTEKVTRPCLRSHRAGSQAPRGGGSFSNVAPYRALGDTAAATCNFKFNSHTVAVEDRGRGFVAGEDTQARLASSYYSSLLASEVSSQECPMLSDVNHSPVGPQGQGARALRGVSDFEQVR